MVHLVQAAAAMKRKRVVDEPHSPLIKDHKALAHGSLSAREPKAKALPLGSKGRKYKPTIQIITGSYEKILHGVTATISSQSDSQSKEDFCVDFADTFLFSAHASAIRCLAISPPTSSVGASHARKATLASGGSDQIINLYHISTTISQSEDAVLCVPPLGGKQIVENPRNKELGSLQHHNSSINVLHFSTRSKLLSAAEDNTIAVTRTRDWTVLSTIKAPVPKAHGRPSGDTAPYGGTPAGVNDFAVHPSLKLMVSVGKGEKCMRLWNLVTGKKAGVLNFERGLLQDIGEGRWACGEGRRVEWNSLGEEFVVCFEKGAVVFGMDSKPRSRVLPFPTTKIHQLRYTEYLADTGQKLEFLAVSTEDGRILFYNTVADTASMKTEAEPESHLPTLEAIGQIGGLTDGLTGRIKDFGILKLITADELDQKLLIVAGCSSGSLRLWVLDCTKFTTKHVTLKGNPGADSHVGRSQTPQVGRLLGNYETGNRITCLKAFQMSEPAETAASVEPLGDGAGAPTKDVCSSSAKNSKKLVGLGGSRKLARDIPQ